MRRDLLKKYVLLGLTRTRFNSKNCLEGLPDIAASEEEQEAFSESLELLGNLIAGEPGAVGEILKLITED